MGGGGPPPDPHRRTQHCAAGALGLNSVLTYYTGVGAGS